MRRRILRPHLVRYLLDVSTSLIRSSCAANAHFPVTSVLMGFTNSSERTAAEAALVQEQSPLPSADVSMAAWKALWTSLMQIITCCGDLCGT